MSADGLRSKKVTLSTHAVYFLDSCSVEHGSLACWSHRCFPMQAADADPLRECAAAVVEYQNRERTEDVLRIAAFALGVPLERLEGAQLLWLDRLGIYLFAATVGGPGAQVSPYMKCRPT